MTVFYEPWSPKIGDQVRYRYQPECPGCYGMRAPVGHPPEYDGVEGSVYGVLAPDNDAGKHGHPYLVRLKPGSITRSICAAAIELEPIGATAHRLYVQDAQRALSGDLDAIERMRDSPSGSAIGGSVTVTAALARLRRRAV